MFKQQTNKISNNIVNLHEDYKNNNIRNTINRNVNFKRIHLPMFVYELPYSFKTVSLITIDF